MRIRLGTRDILEGIIEMEYSKFLTAPKSPVLAITLSLTTLIGMYPSLSLASEWSETFLGYRYGTSYREPAHSENISKNIVTVQHSSGYKYGTNFFNLDILLSDSNDPAAGGGGGATEAYFVYRHNLSLSAATGKTLKLGPIRDIGITAGFDLNTKNDAFGPRKCKLAIGPTLSFDVPGFLNISLLYQTESNRNGIVGTNVHFDDTYDVNLAWGIPFSFGLPAKFKGFADYIGPKGRDGFGADTKAETLIETALMFDVGSVVGTEGVFSTGIGYQYWHNKFGNAPGVGTQASVPQLEMEVHF